MKISTKGRYALRMMLDMTMHSNGSPVRIKDIAARQGISEKYLEQIVSILNKSGYVRSVRGPQGGYLLTKKPEEYTTGMILRLTEGSLAPVMCLEFDDSNCCDKEDDCVTIMLWKKLNDAINDVVDNVTLADLVEWEMAKNGNYNI
ncbi:Rrf2 family protein [Acetitomaculum ruminis DSM 5522]|uniref:Rrf2 family protein n=1 Tax=Acetitomaculum ruminis DSM 5522 TaxID=1120918 RepID=A0A1I0XS40_9FIRM|nr:Rrf2 family transcriptional regulator [Acetitomaculum ruminis]SFB03821.1 Rrf2 family protein [Acetitomaculum ruminis DSM 5522]